MEVVDYGGAAQVEEVLAGTAVAGAAALPVADVGEGVLDLTRSRRSYQVPVRQALERDEDAIAVWQREV